MTKLSDLFSAAENCLNDHHQGAPLLERFNLLDFDRNKTIELGHYDVEILPGLGEEQIKSLITSINANREKRHAGHHAHIDYKESELPEILTFYISMVVVK